MTSVSWPIAVVLCTLLVCTTVLGITHTVSSDWVTHAISGVGGFIAGHALGFWRQKGKTALLNGSNQSHD